MVTVTSAPTTGPTLFPLAQCGSGTGDTVTLGCLATGFTPSSLTFAWSKNGASLSDSIQYPPIQKGNFYTAVGQVRVRRQDWESKQPFRCAVTHAGGSPHVDYFEPPHHQLPTLSVLASSDEGNEASFSCFAKGFSPDKYEFKWLKNEQDVTKKIYEFVTPSKATTDNGTKVYSAASFLTVQGSEWTDGTTFTCLFEGKGDRNLPVYVNSSVTYTSTTPPTPPPCNEGDVDITINGPTMEDIFVKKVGHLECQVLQKMPDVLRVFWEDPMGNEILGSSKKPTNGQKKIFSATIDITYDEWSQGFVRYCVVEHSEWMEPRKTVYERTVAPHHQLPTLSVLASSDEGNEASFSCFAKGFSPDKYEFKWLKNDEDVTKKIYEFVTPSKATTDNGTKVYSAASFLTVQGSEWTQHTMFTCLFEGKGDGNTSVYVNSSVTYESPSIITPPPCNEGDVDITINGPTMEDIFVKKVGHLECQVLQKMSDVLRVFWEDPMGNEILGSSKKPADGQKKIFSATIDITYDEWSQGFVRYCVVEHSEWMEPRKTVYERTTGGQPQRPSVFMLPPLEHTRKETVTLTCFVKDFSPQEVFVSWLVDDEPAQYPYHTTKSVENHGSFSAYGQLSVTLDQWNQKDVVYSCVVYHESIANTTKAIVRSIGHRTFDRTNLVNLNMNIPETCKAQ